MYCMKYMMDGKQIKLQIKEDDWSFFSQMMDKLNRKQYDGILIFMNNMCWHPEIVRKTN